MIAMICFRSLRQVAISLIRQAIPLLFKTTRHRGRQQHYLHSGVTPCIRLSTSVTLSVYLLVFLSHFLYSFIHFMQLFQSIYPFICLCRLLLSVPLSVYSFLYLCHSLYAFICFCNYATPSIWLCVSMPESIPMFAYWSAYLHGCCFASEPVSFPLIVYSYLYGVCVTLYMYIRLFISLNMSLPLSVYSFLYLSNSLFLSIHLFIPVPISFPLFIYSCGLACVRVCVCVCVCVCV